MDTPITAPAAGRFVFATLPARSKMAIAAGAAVLFALIVASTLWSRQPEYRVLFANLSDRDGGAVIAALSQLNIAYKHADGGAAIMVPAGSFQPNNAALACRSNDLPRREPSQSIWPSSPMMRISSPSQLPMADGVMVYGVSQPAARLSSE